MKIFVGAECFQIVCLELVSCLLKEGFSCFFCYNDWLVKMFGLYRFF
jgi:hypothetical protein